MRWRVRKEDSKLGKLGKCVSTQGGRRVRSKNHGIV